MAQSFLKRAMELIKYDTIETAKSYTSNLQDLKNDAKAVANQFQEDTASAAQKSQEAYKRIKSGRIVKDLTDWFYNSAAEAESENNNDNPDDFDPGVDFNGKSSENDNDEQPTVTLPSVADSSKQIAAMYKIGAKQAEASIANTAELVATFNARSAEIIASVTKVNESVLAVEKRLTELIEVTKAGAKANEENIMALNRSIVDERGNINLSKLYDTAKDTNKITKNIFTDFLGIAATAFNGSTPESFFHDIMDLARSNIPFKGKSINDWGEEFNELTGSLSQTLIRNILSNDNVKKILGDTIHTGTEGQDYSEFRVNRYDEKAAVFDGMTRQSIVTIIPGYLKSIDEHLRGRSLNIDEYGELTDKAIEKKQFAKVTRNAFDGASISNRVFNKVSSQIKSTGFDIDDDDIEIASKALMATYVMSMENSGASTLVDSEINANDIGIISYAVSLIQNAVGGDSDYWSMVCRNILFMLEVSVVERNKFIKNVNKSSRAMQQQAMEVASSAKYGNQATTINDSMLFDTFRDVYGKEQRTSVSPYNDNNETNNEDNNGGGSPSPNTPTPIGPNGHTASELITQQETGLAVVNSTGTALAPMENPYKNKTAENTEEKVVNALDTVINKLQVLANSGVRGIAEATGHASSEDELGNNERRDVIDTVSGAVKSVTNIKGTVSNLAHKATNKVRDMVMDKVDDIREDIKVTNNYNSAVEEFKDVNNDNNVSDQDKIIVQTVMQMAQTATVDGDVSTDDISKINSNIDQIADPNIKKKLKASIIPMLNRVNTKATTDVNGDNKGGIIGKVLSGVKKGFNFILKPIKAFLSMAWKGIKAFGKKLFSGVINLFKSGATDVRVGSSALKESLFGVKAQKDADGNIITEGEDGLFQQFVTNPIKGGIGVVKNLGTAAYYGAKGKLTDSLNDPDSKLSKMLESVTNVTSSISSSVKDLINAPKKEKEGEDNSEKASNLIGSFKDKFAETEFGKGFMSVFNKAEEEKKKQRLKTPETMTDINTDEMKQMISGAKESIFTTISKGIDSLVKHFSGESSAPQTQSGKTKSQPGVKNAKPTTASAATVASAGSASPDATDVNASGAGGKKNGSGLFNIGKMLGGITKILGGLGKMIISIITGMAGIKAILNLVENVLKTALRPLNKVFNKIYQLIRPVIYKIGKILNSVAKTVTRLAMSVIKTIMPLLDIMTPILESLWEALEPFIDIITESVEKLLKPVSVVLQTVVAPILERAGAAIQTIAGLTELIYGGLQTGFGNTLIVLGKLLSIMCSSTIGKKMIEYGETVVTEGGTHTENGLNNFTAGIKKSWDLMFNTNKNTNTVSAEEVDIKFNGGIKQENGSLLDGTLIGSGDQASYGSYMNMGKRGCGPIALADSISRRTGKRVDPYQLATAMANNGTYDANRGTSVAGFINTANAMGLGLNAGAVTRESLMSATSKRPVTVIGSGGAYNTQIGNNHYVNVIGANGSTAIVSNPLTGKISRAPLNDLILNSKMGLYGSGDVNGFMLPDSILEPMTRLKELTGGILSLFSIDDASGTAEIEAANNERQYNDIVNNLKSSSESKEIYEEKLQSYEAKAREAFEKDHPMLRGETQEEYDARYNKKKYTYLIKAAAEDADDIEEKNQSLGAKIKSTLKTFFGDKDENGNYTGEVNGEKVGILEALHNDKSEDNSIFSKLFDAVKSIGSSIFGSNKSGSGGADKMVSVARSYIGQKGTHFFEVWGMQTDWCAMFIATCAKESGNEDRFPWSASCNAQIKWWKENNRWLGRISDPIIGDIIYFDWQLPNPESDPDYYKGLPVDHVGLVVGFDGNTITTIEGNSGGTGSYMTSYVKENTYDKNYVKIHGFARPDYVASTNQGKIDTSSLSGAKSGWSSAYRDNPAAKRFIQQGFDAGLSPAQIATIFSTGIWEDSAKKIFGTKSLTDVTYDVNGQAAVGLLNFVDTKRALEYGTTVPDQLRFIKDNYFIENPMHSRGKAINAYRSDYPWGTYYENTINKKPSLSDGTPIGPAIDNDLFEGAAYFTGGAVVPQPPSEVLKYPRTAVDIYNWMIDEGLVTPGTTTDTVPSAGLNVYSASDIMKESSPNVGSGSVNISGSIPSISFSNQGDAEKYLHGDININDYVRIKPNSQFVKITSGNPTTSLFNVPKHWYDDTFKVININKGSGYYTLQGADGTKYEGAGFSKDDLYAVAAPVINTPSRPLTVDDLNKLDINKIIGSGNEPINYNINSDPLFINSSRTRIPIDEYRNGYNSIYTSGDKISTTYTSMNNLYGSGDDFFNDVLNITPTKNTAVSAPTYHVYNSTEKLSRADMINALSSMEFNVSAKRLESLVEKILVKLDEKETSVAVPSVTPSTQSLFNEDIPANVARLYS